jgi:hypothetical protein
MDASLLGMTSQRSTCSAELLSTVAALAGVSKQHAVFMTCSGALVHTACAAGMKAVVVKNSLLCRGAEHPSCAGELCRVRRTSLTKFNTLKETLVHFS